MASSRHSAPMFVGVDNQVGVLVRVILGQTPEEDSNRREAFVQNLVHDHPDVIPMSEIEPAFKPLISVCKELPTPAGYLDNLWITPWGGLVLGEAKLVRNPQARREVVAQALDYARAFSGWTYEDLPGAVRRALKQPAFTLWSLVEAKSDLDEGQFVDAVQRRLSTSRLMLLIIGDGIQEGVEALTAHLQLHAGLHVGLALLDLSLWRNVDGGLIIVPRVPMRTVLIERGVVRIEAENARIDPPAFSTSPMLKLASKPRAASASEGEFFDHLATKRPELVEPIKALLTELADMGIRPEIDRTIKLLFEPSADITANAGRIENSGRFFTQTGNECASTRQARSSREISGSHCGPDLAALLDHKAEWLKAIELFINDLADEQCG